ncbi:MAG: uroporphyrinogen decarboxylase family protein [Treponema sp.]|jgi:uroporphyrinogen decarboxylase|nr:uroporphyrinogen decarboxylase family protein [Treponema sp.]
MKIVKAKETMNARERVQKTFAHEKTDRVTIGYDYNDGIHRRLKEALGIKETDEEGLLQALGVDYRGISAPYTGKPLFPEIPNRQRNQLEGCVMRWVEHGSGGYWDFCDFPLRDADDEAFAAFPVPNPDDFDYEAALEEAKTYGKDYGVYIGGSGTPDIINSNGRIMGMEDVLCNLQSQNEAALAFMRRRADFQLKNLERLLDKCKDYIDFVWFGEDLGTQHAPMISRELYLETMKPIHRKFFDLAKAYGKPSIVHTCGSSSWVYEDFIEMGVSGVDTLQPEAANMAPEYLKAHFGNRLCYRGCISTAGPLAYGTPQEVRENVRRTLEIMMGGYGYHFAPTHQIQDNTPVENVVAMYQAAHDFGVYRPCTAG